MSGFDFAAEGIDVARVSGGPCIEWTGAFFRRGLPYGRCYKPGRSQLAHRVAFEDAHGVRLSRWQLVCHRCDNPKCVNVGHLFLGTPASNMEDKVAKNRQARGLQITANQNPRRGANHPNAKLTPQAVEEIRAAAFLKARYGRAKLAAKYGVSESLIKQVVAGGIWNV